MCVVFPQYSPKQLVLRVMNSLDDIFVVSGEIEETSAFAWRTELGKNVFTG